MQSYPNTVGNAISAGTALTKYEVIANRLEGILDGYRVSAQRIHALREKLEKSSPQTDGKNSPPKPVPNGLLERKTDICDGMENTLSFIQGMLSDLENLI